MHVVQRGNNRQDCFLQDNDRLVYLAILRDLLTLRRCALHAYCLMTNHVHLLLTPTDESGCSLMIRDLARCYSGYFNRRYSRTGQLWEGRLDTLNSTRCALGWLPAQVITHGRAMPAMPAPGKIGYLRRMLNSPRLERTMSPAFAPTPD